MKLNEHGAETEDIYRIFDIIKPKDVIDFSTNTNVVDLQKNINESMIDIDLSLYPDMTNNSVVESITDNIERISGVKMSNNHVLATNGSNEGIYIIASYFANKHVGILQPTYPEYEKAFTAYDAKIHYCYDVKELLNADYSCVFICNPNNPSGSYMKWQELSIVIDQLVKLDITVIIDEAYIDFLLIEDDMSSKYKLCHTQSNVIILRSLTKIYQMAGLRLGYVIASETWIKRIEKRQPSWSVNSIAQKIAKYYLDDETIVLKTKKFYKEETYRVKRKLSQLGYEVIETNVNFYLIKTLDDISLIKYLLRNGIVVRHTKNHPGLNGDYVRIAVRTIDDNNYLIEKLAEYSLVT